MEARNGENINEPRQRDQPRQESDKLGKMEEQYAHMIITEPQVSSLLGGMLTARRSNPMRRAHSPVETILVTPDALQAPYITSIFLEIMSSA